VDNLLLRPVAFEVDEVYERLIFTDLNMHEISTDDYYSIQGGIARWVTGIVVTGEYAALQLAFNEGLYGPYLK
jgi:hypothetical protein